MKIMYLPKLKRLAEKLGSVLGARRQELRAGDWIPDSRDIPGIWGRVRDDTGDENVLFVGTGLANRVLGGRKTYPKCWEVGKKIDSFDYLRKVILNEETVETHKRRRCPEKIVFQKDEYDCGLGMVSTLLLMLQREDVLKTDVYGRLGVNPIDGTKSEKIKELFDEESIAYIEFWKGDMQDIEKIMLVGGVCLVSYQAWGEPEEIERLECGHYSIIFDIDDEFVWLIDPSYDDEEYMPGLGIGVVKRPRSEFERLWVDKGIDGTIYEKWMMAVRV